MSLSSVRVLYAVVAFTGTCAAGDRWTNGPLSDRIHKQMVETIVNQICPNKDSKK